MCLHVFTAPIGPENSMKGDCCPRFTKQAVPKGRVTHVKMTPSDCANEAIV